MRPLDLAGKPFGRLVVLYKMAKGELGWPLRLEPNSFWRCRCKCGELCVVRGSNLARGLTRSCGCFKRELVLAMNVRRRESHGPRGIAQRTRTVHRAAAPPR